MESMRREGFEFQVGRPRVLFKKDENGNKMEPVEQAVVECPDEYSGKVVEVFGTSGGIMTSMDTSGIGRTSSLRFRPAASWVLRTAS